MTVLVQDRVEVFKDDERFARHRDEIEIPTKAEGSPAKFGISITRVEENSFAAEIGIQEKDVIISVNRQPVTSLDDLRKAQSTLKPGDAVAFRVMRPLPAAAANRKSAEAPYQTFFAAGTLPEKE